MKIAISATIGGIYEYPEIMFRSLCYESWGNIWALIQGVEAYYIPRDAFLTKEIEIKEFDVILLPLGDAELIDHAMKKSFIIATQDGAGYNMDTLNGFGEKYDFQERLKRCNIILSTTYGGKEYLSLFTNTPVLDIPLGIDLNYFRPIDIVKFAKFTLYLGELEDSCHGDRPMNILPGAIAKEMNIDILCSIRPGQSFNKENTNVFLPSAHFHEHTDLDVIAFNYLSKCHASMVIAQRSTFGRLVNISWAMGVPCIASCYQCQEVICSDLTVTYDEINKMKSLLIQLRDDEQFYNYCKLKGLENIKQFSNEAIALRLVNEVIPIIIKERNVEN